MNWAATGMGDTPSTPNWNFCSGHAELLDVEILPDLDDAQAVVASLGLDGEDVVRSVAVDADVELVGLYLGLLGEPESGLTTSMDVRMWR